MTSSHIATRRRTGTHFCCEVQEAHVQRVARGFEFGVHRALRAASAAVAADSDPHTCYIEWLHCGILSGCESWQQQTKWRELHDGKGYVSSSL